jgi:hypothetical protein
VIETPQDREVRRQRRRRGRQQPQRRRRRCERCGRISKALGRHQQEDWQSEDDEEEVALARKGGGGPPAQDQEIVGGKRPHGRWLGPICPASCGGFPCRGPCWPRPREQAEAAGDFLIGFGLAAEVAAEAVLVELLA